MAFWDAKNVVALRDPVKGQFQLIATDDGGKNWKRLPGKNLPPALPKEGAFAASGTCLVMHGEQDVWYCTGGDKTARVFHSVDRGENWSVSETPIMAGIEWAGIFLIAFRDRDHGIIVGGDYRKPNDIGATAVITSDSGKTWTLLDKPFHFSFESRLGEGSVGRGGHFGHFGHPHLSKDEGATWKALDRELQQSRIHFGWRGLGLWTERPNREVREVGTDTLDQPSWVTALSGHRSELPS